MMDKQTWLAERRQLVTASDVAALLGESPFKTRDQLRMEKLGLADEFAGSESTDLALALEPFVLTLANARWGWLAVHNANLTIHRDAVCPRLGATPDAIMASPWGIAVVQVKVTQSQPADAIKPSKSGKPSQAAFAAGAPLHYQLQVQAEMACTGYEHGVLLVLHTSPLALRAYYVPRHDGVIARIRSEVTAFWTELEGTVAA